MPSEKTQLRTKLLNTSNFCPTITSDCLFKNRSENKMQLSKLSHSITTQGKCHCLYCTCTDQRNSVEEAYNGSQSKIAPSIKTLNTINIALFNYMSLPCLEEDKCLLEVVPRVASR